MPIYDFVCGNCQHEFEDIVVKSEIPACPKCAGTNITKKVSAPSPLKTGAFPYKIGPVHAAATMPRRGGCPSSGGCGGGGGSP